MDAIGMHFGPLLAIAGLLSLDGNLKTKVHRLLQPSGRNLGERIAGTGPIQLHSRFSNFETRKA